MAETCEIPKHTLKKEEIAAILKTHKNVAIVGLSSKPDRPSHGVASYLKSKGYRIIPVNPSESEILGETCYPNLEAIPDKVEIVDVFRKPEFLPPISKQAVQIGAKVLWMQEGIINNEAADIATKAGLKVVMNRCILKEHKKLFS